jgi:hypothetical protein
VEQIEALVHQKVCAVREARCGKICKVTRRGKSNAAPGLNPLNLAFPGVEPVVEPGLSPFQGRLQ